MDKKKILLLVICAGSLLYWICNWFPNSNMNDLFDNDVNKSFSMEEMSVILEEAYIESNQILAKSESAKTILELEKGIGYLEEAIKQHNILSGKTENGMPEITTTPKETVIDPGEICSEKYGDSREDYPLYLKNIPFDPTCKAPAIHNFVTVLFNFVNEIPIEKAKTLIEDAAYCRYNSMSYLAYFPSGHVTEELKKLAAKKLPNMRLFESGLTEPSHPDLLYDAVSQISTKYVVIARNTERFDNFSTIERMVRDISLGKAVAIGGAHRNSSGHWKAGCYQYKILRGEMKFDEGYDLSDNGCMYCDYVSGPFGTTKNLLLTYLKSSSDENLNGDFLYMDFFMHIRLELKQKIFVCFDAMYYTETTGLQPFQRTKWLPFTAKHNLGKVDLPEITFEFSCEETKTHCKPNKDRELPVCCAKEAENLLKVVTEKMKKNNISFSFLLPINSLILKETFLKDKSKNIIALQIPDLNAIKKTFQDDDRYAVDIIGDHIELIFNNWRIVFYHKIHKEKEKSYTNVQFGNLTLPVIGNIGEALKNEDKCTKENVCFDLLREYGTLNSYKVWM